ncbi:MAG: multidrug efflux RND transporter permease subunit [Victivallaceae bacterium]
MISKFFIEHPRFAFVIAIVITIAGLIAIKVLPVAQYPNITPSQVQISATYPGADALTVQQTVIEPIEAQVNGVKGMLYMSSISSDSGSAVTTVTFDIGSDGDMNTVNVQNRVNWATAQLPDEVKRQGVIVKEKSSNMLLVICLSSPNGTYDSLFLSNYLSNKIKDEITRIPGVGDANILGEMKYSMRVWLDPDKMASLKMDVEEVSNAIKSQNVQVSAGAVGDAPSSKKQLFRYAIQTQGRLKDVKEFENIVIRALPDGSNIKIQDVGTVELGAENYSSSGWLNGKPSALLAVYQLNDANGLQIADACRKKLAELKQAFPKDLDYGVQYDTTQFISASISEVVMTLFIAVLLVVLVTWLFLQDWRATLIPTVAIPVSLVGTFAILLAAGYNINLITLFGLILAIGIVVDDAILVIESVNRMIEEEGLTPKEAAIKTMEQVTSPAVATTLVLLAMFIPVCFLPGITGEMYRQFGVTISVAVSLSTLNALTLSPALSALILKPKDKTIHRKFFLFVWFEYVFDKITGGYSKTVSLLVRKAFIVILLYLGLMGITWKIYGLLPTGFIPNEDQGAFFVNVQLPDGAALVRTQKVVDRAMEIIKATPGVSNIIASTGFSILTGTNASNSALMIGILDPWDKRKTPELSQDAIISQLRKKLFEIPEAMIMPFSVPVIPGVGNTGGFSFVMQDTTGTDPQKLFSNATSLIVAANQDPELTGVFTTFRANVPQVYLDIDREKALKMGVSISTINNALQGLMGYSYVNDFNKFGKVYKVEVQAQQPYRSDVNDISGLYVRSNNNEMVPMSTLVQVSTRFAPQYLNRYNMYSAVNINGDSAPGYSSGEAMKTMQKLAKKILPSGMKYDWTDMSYQEKLASGKIGIVFALALTFIYLFLVAQYESFMIPLAVMLSVPVAFFGALVSLWAVGIDNNIYTQVGFVILFGIACKTAILIVEFAKVQHDEHGMSVVDSAIFAAKLRFRAVVMTAVSFVLGTFPLVIAVGAGASSRRSLGTAVFGGMTVSCIFGTILVPTFYVVIQHTINWSKKKKTAPATD